jgi:sterol desaturase/sphingolipid hydroxylase (fatty acid hydroxylase superfamily)
VAGFFDYAWHRWFSHHRYFWFTHEYHHLPSEVFVGMPGLATRPFVVVTIVPVVVATVVTVYVALRLAGRPMWDWTVFQGPLLASTTVLTTSHSSLLRRSWRVHRVMQWLGLTTPQEHLLHHTVDLDGNYGNFTSLWDRVFGTYLDPRRSENQGHRTGLAYDQDFIGTLTAGALRIPARWHRRIQLDRYVNVGEHEQ